MTSRVLFSFAHPDDETFLSACLIRQLADVGSPPSLILATRGDAGKKNGDYGHLPSEELGALREKEMDKAGRVLGLGRIVHLGYPDGKLAESEAQCLESLIAAINALAPEIVFTFPLDGGNGHPDHMAISRMTTRAVQEGHCPSVRQLYYVMSESLHRDGHEPTFAIDTTTGWAVKAEALRCHESQKHAIARHFGSLAEAPANWRFEAFVLAWEQGTRWPGKTEEAAQQELGIL